MVSANVPAGTVTEEGCLSKRVSAADAFLQLQRASPGAVLHAGAAGSFLAAAAAAGVSFLLVPPA